MITGCTFWCDPSATRKGDGTDDSFWSVMRSLGFPVNTAPGNNLWQIRKGAMEAVLMRITPNGDPGFIIHARRCPILKNALEAGYVNGDDGQPDKKKSGVYADAADGCQYMILGGGEGIALINGPPKDKPQNAPAKPKPKRYQARNYG